MSNPKPPRSFWIIAVLALVWMAFGVFAWVMDLITDESQLATLDEARKQLFAQRPRWIFAVYAVAIGSGFLGALALVLRKAIAVPLFLVSLVTVVVQFGYILGVMDTVRLLGWAQAATFPLVIFAIGAFLLWYPVKARKRQWIQ